MKSSTFALGLTRHLRIKATPVSVVSIRRYGAHKGRTLRKESNKLLLFTAPTWPLCHCILDLKGLIPILQYACKQSP